MADTQDSSSTEIAPEQVAQEQSKASSKPDATSPELDPKTGNGVEDQEQKAVTQPAEDKQMATKGNADGLKPGPVGDAAVPDALLKTTRRPDDNYKRNNKFDASVLPESDDANEIRRQIEFYLSTSNLDSGDKYMLELCGGTDNKPISIETLSSFKRMRRFRPVSIIVDALRSSKELDVVGEPGKEMVKRKVAWQQSEQSRIDARSIYAKGFGDEQPSTQFDIETFFEPYGPIVSVRLRRTYHKLFKGSVFVEFKDDETYQKFLALDSKPLWQGKHELLIRPKTEYVKEKNQSIINGDTELGKGFRNGGRGRGDGQRGRGRGRGRSNGDRDPDDWKKRRQDDQANGFKDRRGNKQGRGRGRGGRDRNEERRDDHDKSKDGTTVASETPAAKAPEADAPASGSAENGNAQKRAREDDAGAEEKPAKKIDTKSEVVTDA